MELTDSHYTQLIVALTLGLLLFVAAYVASEKSVISLIVATLPFQMITSAYGTLNTVLIYMVGLIFLMRGRIRKFPLLGSGLFILLVLLLSMSQSPRQTYSDHFFYIVTICSNFVLFYIVYNYFSKKTVNPSSAINLFLFTGFLVLFFSTIKLVFKFDPGITFGIDELSVLQNRDDKQRFISVFNAAGINGAFHATQLVVVTFLLMYVKGPMAKAALFILFVGNAAFLIATGSRGSFLSGMGGLVLALFLMARHISKGKALAIGMVSVVLFAGASFTMLKFTNYNVLYERLMSTEFKGLTPDTRDFSYTIERIPDKMILGHGPRLKLVNEYARRIPGHRPHHYPHNLYLHILYTVGVVGLIAYLTFFTNLFVRYLRPLRYRTDSPVLNAAPRIAIVVMVMFLVDELKIEFLRFGLSDYQHVMFALWAMLLALCDRAVIAGREQLAMARIAAAERDHTQPGAKPAAA